MKTETIIVSVVVPLVSAFIAVSVPIIYQEMKERKKAGKSILGAIKRILLRVVTIIWHAIPYVSLALVIYLWFFFLNKWNAIAEGGPWGKDFVEEISVFFDYVTDILAGLILILSIYCLLKTIKFIRNAIKKRRVQAGLSEDILISPPTGPIIVNHD